MGITAIEAAALDSKALNVMRLDFLKELGASPATEFVIPFAIS